ncbi:MAG: hypothetical protein HKN76_11430 [Saprospiraceae bacterium]|nr:hypothetical protein [Saprospiraceae bacterium]
MHCCRTQDYSDLFDSQKALADLNDYRKNGVKKSSRPLFVVIDQLPLQGQTLLDIGGGIGAVVFELFAKGIRYAEINDISAAYIKQFREESVRQEVVAKSRSFIGDFTSVHRDIAEADLITLDKVICCYPDYRSLVQLSSAKARRWYAINLPRNAWWVYILMRIDYYWQKMVRGKAFLTYFHPLSEIETQLAQAGFRKIKQKTQNEWVALLFERDQNV